VTHDPVAAVHADRVVFLADGQIVGELQQPGVDAVADQMAHLTDGRHPAPAQLGSPW
jgi:putative ABC transport system ATP-binding protein